MASKSDANTSYFDACISVRRKSSQLVALRVDQGWAENATQIKMKVVSHFARQFEELVWDRPVLDGTDFPLISVEDDQALGAIFGMDELEDANKSVMGTRHRFGWLQLQFHQELLGDYQTKCVVYD